MLGFTLRRRSGPSEGRRRAHDDLKRRLRLVLGLHEEGGLGVNEIACVDPGCPGVETVVLVMRPGERTRALPPASHVLTADEPGPCP